jgi:hypothetical protein
MNPSLHGTYIVWSFVAALVATMGIGMDEPVIYGIVPGLIGGTLALVATVRFLRRKTDLAGFVATVCGFVFYQAFQANPVMLPEFSARLADIGETNRMVGIFLGNFTTGMLLLARFAVAGVLVRPIRALVPSAGSAVRGNVDRLVWAGFLIVFTAVAVPNVLFGRVVIGAINAIVYQRASWAAGEFSGYDNWAGASAASLLNTVYCSTSLFLLWVYLLGSQYRRAMLVLSPLVLIWSASVALQGSRTYLVILGFALLVYFIGSPWFKTKAYVFGALGLPIMFVILQATSLYRNQGLQSIDFKELATRLLEIRGNEGTISQMDGLEFYRLEFSRKETAPNPVIGFVRGMVERPIEGLMMPLPRSLFPWKPVDDTAREFTLFFQNVRLGVTSVDTFLGASPGLIGREIIRYGIFGPISLLFWMGVILALADRLYETAAGSDFHRIFAAVLVAFLVAQMRDWVPMWFLPFLPAFLILSYVARRVRFMRRVARARGRTRSQTSSLPPLRPRVAR